MIFEVDTVNKTVRVKNQCTIDEMNKEFRRLLGDDYINYNLVPEHNIQYIPYYQTEPVYGPNDNVVNINMDYDCK